MARPLSDDTVRAVRMRAQRLAGPPARDAAAAVAAVGALQAQATAPARLAVRARTRGLVAADVDRAADRDRTVVRTWAMRGTLHLLPAADLRWVVALLGPVAVRADARRRAELGLDDATCERALEAIPDVLRGTTGVTRAALVACLADRGVRVEKDGQAPAHLVAYAAAHGLVCRGPETGDGEPTYVLVEEWLQDSPATTPADPAVELVRRYLTGHAPATARDVVAWSSLPAAEGARAIDRLRDELVEVALEGGGPPAFAPAGVDLDPPADLPVRLLGHFDAYLLGYRGRDRLLDPRYAARVRAGGMISPTVLAGGRIVGRWRRERNDVVVEPFDRLPRGSVDALHAEAADVGRFLGVETSLSVAG